MFCFRENKYTYFGCLPIVGALGLAVFIAIATQYYVSVFFLIQHNWFWFITLVITVPAHALLFWAIYSRKALLFYPLMVYQGLFILLFIGCIVWMVVDLFNPKSSRIYTHCGDATPSYCKSRCKTCSETRLLAGINIGVFIVSALLNIFVLDVFFRFRNYIDSGGHRPTVNVVSVQNTVSSPTYRDPTHNMVYSPGNVYQPQPLQVPTLQPQQQARENPTYQPYPTVRGATSPAYPATAPISPHIYEAPPPAYSQAVSDKDNFFN